jgi:AraC-like DNA-binding protein
MHLFGTQTRPPGCFSFSGFFSTFAIIFKSLASWQLFRIPPAQFADQEFNAREVFGPWITELWFRLAECEMLHERIRVATEALVPFAEHASPLTRTMAAAHRLVATDFDKRVRHLARESCMSVRTFERKFVAEMGLPPKRFARLRRFQLALDRKRVSGTTWLDVVHDLGYFDQMHMVKEFRAFGGDAPSLLLEKCGDYQPSSLEVALTSTRTHTLIVQEIQCLPSQPFRELAGYRTRGDPEAERRTYKSAAVAKGRAIFGISS